MENASVYGRTGHSEIAAARGIIRVSGGARSSVTSMTSVVLCYTGFLAGEGLRLTSP